MASAVATPLVGQWAAQAADGLHAALYPGTEGAWDAPDFVFAEEQPMTSVGKPIGNAVSPVLPRLIAESLGEHLTLESPVPAAA